MRNTRKALTEDGNEGRGRDSSSSQRISRQQRGSTEETHPSSLFICVHLWFSLPG